MIHNFFWKWTVAQICTWDWGDNSGIFAIFSKIQTLRGTDLFFRYGNFCVILGLMKTGFMLKNIQMCAVLS